VRYNCNRSCDPGDDGSSLIVSTHQRTRVQVKLIDPCIVFESRALLLKAYTLGTILRGQGEVRPGQVSQKQVRPAPDLGQTRGLFEGLTFNPDFVILSSDLRVDLLHRDGGRGLWDFSIV
jgi:hypothetical protein